MRLSPQQRLEELQQEMHAFEELDRQAAENRKAARIPDERTKDLLVLPELEALREALKDEED